MPAKTLSRLSTILGLATVLVLVFVGTFRSFSRGSLDFGVFYEAWRLVLADRGADIYRVSPDRFLYAPGFAWLLSPLALLPRHFSLLVWCLAKIGVVAWLIQALSRGIQARSRWAGLGVVAWGVVLVARPILIDFEYGQVNLFILGACCWGLLGHLSSKDALWKNFIQWLLLAFAAFAKLFPLPLLVVPWVFVQGIPAKKLKVERAAVLLGFIITVFLPVVSQGWNGAYQLLWEWRDAVIARGLPLESHNQSFTALLYHYLSGHPTPVISEGMDLFFGRGWLSQEQITLFSLSWSACTLGLILGWIVSGANHSPLKWVVISVALLVVPSHLVWKPYFVFSLPMAMYILRNWVGSSQSGPKWLTLILFFLINLTGFDFVGHSWAAHFEAASILLLTHLAMIFLVLSFENRRDHTAIQ